MACLWPKSGKQERTSPVLSFHAICGPDESVRCGPDLDIRNFAIWAGAQIQVQTHLFYSRDSNTEPGNMNHRISGKEKLKYS